ncbi:MAG TPA: UvrD-helicase domain-containing protein [Chthoniobacterales bacterium]
MSAPADQEQRDQFRDKLETNFSVIAAAGSGKTRAVTDRIAQMARHARALDWLPKLVVVTFTHRAADEMQRRARQAILAQGVPLEVLAAFDRAYFGTIHSFCVKLLNDFGHYLGLPPHLDLIADDSELWHDFVQSYTSVGRNLPEESRRILLRHVRVRQLMELGRRGNLALPDAKEPGPCPVLNFEPIYRFSPEARSRARAEFDQKAAREWEQLYGKGADFLPLIENTCTAQKFVEAWDEVFGSFRKWMTQAALSVAAEVQRAYRDFRVDHGGLTYNDQVALADSLFDFPAAADRIRERDFRVILDEAQDTDPQQFAILLEAARPPGARGRWLETEKAPPRPGHYCMVGDLQQSIFSDRADLHMYRRIHDRLMETGAGQALKFTVTFRLDRKQVDFINAIFPALLNEEEGQIRFVDLNARPTVLPGQIVRLNIAAEEGDDKRPERYRAELEAKQLADWIKRAGLTNLRARSWSEVAILCPRKAWFRPLRDALRRAGLEVQTQSESELNADNPAHAWFAALATIMARPRAGYEIVGVLREIFGVSDHDLAFFSQGYGDRFHLVFRTKDESAAGKALNLLVDLRKNIQAAPLYQAAREIVARTQLRERLLSLPVHEYGDLGTELDRLLVAAATAESEGLTLADFAHELRVNFDGPRESEPPQPNALQLITGKKAKGSEWDAVIVPFLARDVRTPSPDYARVVKMPQTGELIVALGKDDMSKQARDALKLADRQEAERLLYVALTRAKHTLVLAFDKNLFHTAKNAHYAKSQAACLRADAANGNVLTWLPQDAINCTATEAAQAELIRRRKLEREVAALPNFAEDGKETGLSAANDFVRKLTPSRVARDKQVLPVTGADSWKEMERELRPLAVDSPATRYGIWWHEFAQRIPWLADEKAQEKMFREAEKESSNKGRSRREWELLRKQLANGLREKLGAGQSALQTEMPFLWPGEDSRCVEGIIDLAIIDPARKRWLIIDWKTNQVQSDQAPLLRAQYLAQMAAYWRAISAMTGLIVEVEIYATATGQFLPYKREELAREWDRLRKLPVNELTRELVRE